MKNEKNNPQFSRFSKKFKEARESSGLKWESNPSSFDRNQKFISETAQRSERERFRPEIIGPQIGEYDG